MEHLTLEDLNKRVAELERLTWSVFRSLETYATFNAPPANETPWEQEDESQKA